MNRGGQVTPSVSATASAVAVPGASNGRLHAGVGHVAARRAVPWRDESTRGAATTAGWTLVAPPIGMGTPRT